MGVKLTALLFFSIFGLISYQGCGSGDEEGDVAAATTAATAAATTVAPTTTAEAPTTTAPSTEASYYYSSTEAPSTEAPTTVAPDCATFKCDCDQATCSGADIPAECLVNCDTLLESRYLVTLGADSCEFWEFYYYGAPVCAGCECDTPAPPDCEQLLDYNGNMMNCDEVSAANPTQFPDCETIETASGGVPVCAGCECLGVDTGYGHAYGYGFA